MNVKPRPVPLLCEHDIASWAAYVQTVRPLAGKLRPPAPLPPRAAIPPASAAHAAAPRRPPLPPACRDLTTGIHPPGLDKSSWNRFRTGKLTPARTLDLHGKTAQAAHHALQAFLLAACADRLRCVEIITGRGSGEAGGVIRRELPLWLNLPAMRPLILAAAHPHAANPGATRLLLRRVQAAA